MTSRIEEQLPAAARVAPAPTPSGCCCVAAAEPVGDADAPWRAAERSAIGARRGRAGRDADLIELGARVRFRHPLVRSAVYRAAPLPSAGRLHARSPRRPIARPIPIGAPGTARRRPSAPTRRWPAELERSADRAQARGGVAAAAAFLERAAELTPDPAERGSARAGRRPGEARRRRPGRRR